MSIKKFLIDNTVSVISTGVLGAGVVTGGVILDNQIDTVQKDVVMIEKSSSGDDNRNNKGETDELLVLIERVDDLTAEVAKLKENQGKSDSSSVSSATTTTAPVKEEVVVAKPAPKEATMLDVWNLANKKVSQHKAYFFKKNSNAGSFSITSADTTKRYSLGCTNGCYLFVTSSMEAYEKPKVKTYQESLDWLNAL